MKQWMRRPILLALLAMLSAGCHTVRFELSDPTGAQVVRKQNHFWFFGLAPGNREVDVRQYCPAGAAAIREQTGFVDGLISLLTIGIFETRTAWYYCLPSRAHG